MARTTRGRGRAGHVAAGAPPLGARLGESRGRPALLVNGVVQSVAPESAAGGYWEAMVPEVRPRRALLLGLGGGTLAHLIVARFGPVPVVAVDDDPAVVKLARSAFGPLPDGVQIVLTDAFRFVAGCAGRFDWAAVDLFHGGTMPRGVFGQPFLRAVRAAVGPNGRAVFNLFEEAGTDERVERLATVWRVERSVHVGANRVVHLHA